MRLLLIKGNIGFRIDYAIDTVDRAVRQQNAAHILVDTAPITDDDYLQSHVVHFGKA